MREKKTEIDKILVVAWSKLYKRDSSEVKNGELNADEIKTSHLILQEYEEGITEYGMITEDEKGLPLILSDFKYFHEFRENYSQKK